MAPEVGRHNVEDSSAPLTLSTSAGRGGRKHPDVMPPNQCSDEYLFHV
jgi:hypothetical protein